MTCEVEMAVAAYVLGTLDDSEHAAVAAHLPACPACSTRRAELAALPGLLATVPPHIAGAGLPAPEQHLLDRVLTAAWAEEAQRRRRRRVLAVAAAVALLLGAVGVAQLRTGEGNPRAGVTVAGTQGPVQARVHLQPVAEGTDLAMELSGVASGQLCQLVVVGTDGSRQVAASWEASYSGTATIRGHTSVGVSRMARIVIETTDQRRSLVEMPVP